MTLPLYCAAMDNSACQKRSKRYSEYDMQRIANDYRLSGAVEIVQPIIVPVGDCADEKDLPVLGTAVAAQTQYLITGDGHLLDLAEYRGVFIVTPRAFYEAMVKHTG
ncbi:MAG TPA: hypothetical protein PKM88_14365, partial [bacterium]|nr:hypothetical protein [bacterium]